MNRFLFTQQNADGSTSIYSTDGTAAGTTDLDVARFGYHTPAGDPAFTEFGGKDVFLGDVGIATTSGFGSTDGTAAGTVVSQFLSINSNEYAVIGQRIDVVNGRELISASTIYEDTSAAGPDEILASTNGTSYTTIESAIGIGPEGVVSSGKVGFFDARLVDMQGNQQPAGLWRTDGTEAGTYAVDGSAATSPDVISLGNGKAVYTESDGTLWTTDGSRAGAHRVVASSIIQNVGLGNGGATAGGKAIFTAVGADGNVATWATDGTAKGTVELLVATPTGNLIRTPDTYVTFGKSVLFGGDSGLTITDGTKTGTKLLAAGHPESITVAGSKAFFFQPGASGQDIYVTDGTAKGTKAIAPAGLASFNGDITAVGSEVVFTGTDTAGKAAVFHSDGTMAGSGELSLPPGDGVPDGGGIAALPVVATPPAPTPPAVVTLGPGDQVYKATAGQTVVAGSGNDTIIASAGTVTVTGSSGKLTFFGGAGASSVFGGTGSSLIFGGSGGGHFTGGTAGGNVLVSQGAAGGNTTLTGGGAGDQLFGSAKGNDVLIAGAGRESVLGGGGPTTIEGGSAADVIFAGAGATQVDGGIGAGDTIVGGAGTLSVAANGGDAIFGGSGHLAVTGSGSGADSIVGGSGGLAVSGTGGNMLVVAGTGASSISTGTGASLIFEGSGSSTVAGGAGSMNVVLGHGKASVTDGAGPTAFEVIKGAASGTDMLSGFKVGTDAINLFGYSAADTHISVGGGNTLISLVDGTRITVVGVTDLGKGLVV